MVLKVSHSSPPLHLNQTRVELLCVYNAISNKFSIPRLIFLSKAIINLQSVDWIGTRLDEQNRISVFHFGVIKFTAWEKNLRLQTLSY